MYIIKPILNILLFLVMPAILNACSYSVEKLYDSQELPRKDVAIIWVDWNDESITSIDGKKVNIDDSWGFYSLLPGEHSFIIKAKLDPIQALAVQGCLNIPVITGDKLGGGINIKTVTKALEAGQCYYVGQYFEKGSSYEKDIKEFSGLTYSAKMKCDIYSYSFGIYNAMKDKKQKNNRQKNRCLKVRHGVFTMKRNL
ncbi:hypothetical protein MNBD_GAMMA11-197 [hydrothermal vent metagenome]|uniref:Uncharacterized protein n=1 Tax=hydrothermal vent metagenome TaxID=652676 RepID=A0A3B0XFJ0_9ZZZZ